MSRTVVDAEIAVFKPDNSTTTPDFTVPAADIEHAETSQRLQALKDEGKFRVDNTGGKYSSGTDTITTGDKIAFRTQLDGESSLSHHWTAIVKPPSRQGGPGKRTLEFGAADFVWQVLSWRIYFNAFEDRPISGSSSAILETVLSDKAPEIGQSQIQDVGASTDYFADGTKLFDIVEELARQGDAYVTNDGEDLVFEPLSGITPSFSLMRGRGGDVGTYSVGGSDDELANWVRVNGGTGTAIGDQQTTQDSYTTVTESSRLTHQLSTRKSEIDRVELWTRTTGSGEDLIVRLQKDDGGSPIAPGDRESDIARRTLAAPFLADADYTSFLLPEHTLPEANPWMIVETDGSSGQEVGVDSSTGDPTYKAHFPFPLDVRTSDQASIDKYRKREKRIKNDQLDTRTATQNQAQSTLDHQSEPRETISTNAQSVRAHNLSPGDAVSVDWPTDGAVGTFLVTDVKDTLSAGTNRLDTTLELQEAGSL